MSVITEYVKIIKSAQGKELFKLPIGTVLDRIISDLWNDMARYIFDYRFILCDRSNPLEGFRAVKKDEFDSVKAQFIQYYYENGGIHNFQDMHIKKKDMDRKIFNGVDMYTIIDQYYAHSKGGCLTCDFTEDNTKIIFKEDIIKNGLDVSRIEMAKVSSNIHLILMVYDPKN